VSSGQLIQIVDLGGKQVASLVALSGDARQERLSTPVTITANASLVLKVGDKLYSNRYTAVLELVEDTVGRHDLLTSPLPLDPEITGKTAPAGSTLDALVAAATDLGIENADLSDPVNLFKHVVIKQRGEIDVRESLSERNDTVVLRVLVEAVVIVANAFPEKKAGVAAARPTNGRTGQMLVRVYR
jgi:uncharacterized protein YcgI (DUF1989 family)